MKNIGLTSALLAFTALSTAPVALAGGFNQAIVFGDSAVDDGYYRYTSTGLAQFDALVANAVANGGSGDFAGPGGIVNSNRLAGMFGLGLAPSSNGGTDFANGGALTASPYATAIDGLPFPAGVPAQVATTQQIANYLAAVHGAANPNGLYLIDTGGNDFTLATAMVLGAFAAAAPGVYATWTMAQGQAYLAPQAQALANSVAQLQAAGARTIVIPNFYVASAVVGAPAAVGAVETQISTYFYSNMWADLTAKGVNFIPADYNAVLGYVSNNPTRFGFTAATVLSRANNPLQSEPCPIGSTGFICGAANSAALFPISSASAQQTSLFVDGMHLSDAGQTIEADYVYSLLTAPSEMSLLPKSALQTGLALTSTIENQIDITGETRGPDGINAWVSAGAYGLKVKNAGTGFSPASGTPFNGTVGADYRWSNGLILGGAVTVGTDAGHESFSNGGYFSQDSQVFTLYGAYQKGGIWGDALASAGFLNDHTTRPVPLGLLTDINSAKPDGQRWTFAARGGYGFSLDNVTTGPVLGVVRQTVTIDGFTENGTTGVTALSFAHQTQNSLVTPLGWRASVAMGDLSPFAEVDWNHEWADRNHHILTSLTTVAAAPYLTPSAPEASDWGTVSLGASYKLGASMALRGTLSANFANQQASIYGGQLSLSAGF